MDVFTTNHPKISKIPQEASEVLKKSDIEKNQILASNNGVCLMKKVQIIGEYIR